MGIDVGGTIITGLLGMGGMLLFALITAAFVVIIQYVGTLIANVLVFIRFYGRAMVRITLDWFKRG